MTQHITPCLSDLDHGPAVVRALSSLSRLHVDAVLAIVTDGWTVQTIDDYDGYLSIIVEPHEDASGKPAYLVSGTIRQIELTEIQNETPTTLLTTTNMHHIATSLAQKIVLQAGHAN